MQKIALTILVTCIIMICAGIMVADGMEKAGGNSTGFFFQTASTPAGYPYSNQGVPNQYPSPSPAADNINSDNTGTAYNIPGTNPVAPYSTNAAYAPRIYAVRCNTQGSYVFQQGDMCYLLVMRPAGYGTTGSNAPQTPSSGSTPQTGIQNSYYSNVIDLNSQNEVPYTGSSAYGQARITLNGRRLTVEGTFANLEGDLMNVEGSAAHIHYGLASEMGPVVFNLEVSPYRYNRSGTFYLSRDLTDEQVNELLAGDFYINVHSDAYPDGEIRGQIILTTQ